MLTLLQRESLNSVRLSTGFKRRWRFRGADPPARRCIAPAYYWDFKSLLTPIKPPDGDGYCFDIGCPQFVINKMIKVGRSPRGIGCFEQDFLVVAGDSKLNVDIVVLATKYHSMRTSPRKILGEKVGD